MINLKDFYKIKRDDVANLSSGMLVGLITCDNIRPPVNYDHKTKRNTDSNSYDKNVCGIHMITGTIVGFSESLPDVVTKVELYPEDVVNEWTMSEDLRKLVPNKYAMKAGIVTMADHKFSEIPEVELFSVNTDLSAIPGVALYNTIKTNEYLSQQVKSILLVSPHKEWYYRVPLSKIQVCLVNKFEYCNMLLDQVSHIKTVSNINGTKKSSSSSTTR